MAKIEERNDRGEALDCNLTDAIPQHSSLYCKGVNLDASFRSFRGTIQDLIMESKNYREKWIA
jgi:hypothetical protein